MEMIQISGSVAVTLILAAVGMMFGFGKILLSQFNKSLDERFENNDEAQQQIRESIRTESFRSETSQGQIRETIRKESERIDVLSRQLQSLPLEYVRREDWIRFSAVIDNKLDRLAELTIKSMQRGSSDA